MLHVHILDPLSLSLSLSLFLSFSLSLSLSLYLCLSPFLFLSLYFSEALFLSVSLFASISFLFVYLFLSLSFSLSRVSSYFSDKLRCMEDGIDGGYKVSSINSCCTGLCQRRWPLVSSRQNHKRHPMGCLSLSRTLSLSLSLSCSLVISLCLLLTLSLFDLPLSRSCTLSLWFPSSS